MVSSLQISGCSLLRHRCMARSWLTAGGAELEQIQELRAGTRLCRARAAGADRAKDARWELGIGKAGDRGCRSSRQGVVVIVVLVERGNVLLVVVMLLLLRILMLVLLTRVERRLGLLVKSSKLRLRMRMLLLMLRLLVLQMVLLLMLLRVEVLGRGGRVVLVG